MEALKIKAYQVFANYRKPMSYNFVDTYPLPPLSTVKGWFHNVINAEKTYYPVSMSIQGISSSVVYDMQKLIKFARIDKKKEQVILESFKKAFSQSPTYVANIYDIELVIYFLSEKDNLEKFRKNLFEKEYPHIGRYEDLIRIDYIDFVGLEEKTFSMRNNHNIDYGIYLRKAASEKLGISGVNFRMPFKYEIRENLRYFSEKIDVVYADHNQVTKGIAWYDKDENRITDFIGDYHE